MEVEAMVRPVVEAAGLELVEATFVREQGRRILRVTVDREGGVDLDTIGEVSERVSRRLDLEGFDPGPYSLEVSSPGVERPLRQPRNFIRAVGQRVRIKLVRPVDEVREVRGTITEADEDHVRVATDDGVMSLAYQDIATARTEYDWTQDLKGGKR
jgi:ribosome maturation factor RimP